MTDTDLKIHSHPGKPKGLRPKSNKPSIKFADHRVSVTEPPTPTTDPNLVQLEAIQFNMDGNGPDNAYGANFPGAGDCVIAMTDHGLQVIDYLTTGHDVPWTPAMVKMGYASQNPKFTWDTNKQTGSGSAADGGCDIQTWLEWCTKHGFDGQPVSESNPPIILGFAEVDYTDEQEFDAAIYLGLALFTGVDLQDAQMDQFDEGKDWAVVKGSPDDGGHGVPYVYYGTDKKPVTWATLFGSTEGFVKKRMNQCFFVITQNLVNNPNFRSGYNLESFAAAYEEMTGKTFPAVTTNPPVPAPTPSPVPDPPGPIASMTMTVTDVEVIKHLHNAIGMDQPSDWLTHHLKYYFKIQD